MVASKSQFAWISHQLRWMQYRIGGQFHTWIVIILVYQSTKQSIPLLLANRSHYRSEINRIMSYHFQNQNGEITLATSIWIISRASSMVAMLPVNSNNNMIWHISEKYESNLGRIPIFAFALNNCQWVNSFHNVKRMTNRLNSVSRMSSMSCSRICFRVHFLWICSSNEYMLPLRSLASDSENRKLADPNDAKLAIKRSGIDAILNCSKTAIVYPIGVFQSNGSLCKNNYTCSSIFITHELSEEKQIQRLKNGPGGKW